MPTRFCRWLAAGGALAMVLAACARLGPPMGMGQPDLILEEAGDMGRYLAPGETPQYPWKTSAKVYFYLGQNAKVRVTEAGSKRAELAPEERDTVEKMLQRHRQGQPIN